jgi:hypothetical protein
MRIVAPPGFRFPVRALRISFHPASGPGDSMSFFRKFTLSPDLRPRSS